MEVFLVLLFVIGIPSIILGTAAWADGLFEGLRGPRGYFRDRRQLNEAKSKYDEAWAEHNYTDGSGIDLKHVENLLTDQLSTHVVRNFRDYASSKRKYVAGDERWQLKS
jgi:hypothetical protein